MSLGLYVIPTCFKKATILLVPEKSIISHLNNYSHMEITSIVMKFFEGMVQSFICSCLPTQLDPLQFGYRPNRSTDDTITLALHMALSHLEWKNTLCENAVH